MLDDVLETKHFASVFVLPKTYKKKSLEKPELDKKQAQLFIVKISLEM